MEHFGDSYWTPIDKAHEASDYLTDLRPPEGMIEAKNGDWVDDPRLGMSNGDLQEDIA